MPRGQRYALILFDEDGYTSIVPTSELNDFNGDLKPSTVCKYLHYTVEILKLSDTKRVLNHYESIWCTSPRATAISKTILQHGDKKDGYLVILPDTDNDVNAETTDINGESTTLIETASDDNRTISPSNDEELPQPLLQMTNGKRKQNNDNTETINVEEHKLKKTRSIMTQTSEVVVVEDETQLSGLMKTCICKEVKETLKTQGHLLENIIKSVNELKEQMTDKLNGSFMSVDILEQLTGNASSVKNLEEGCNVTSDEICFTANPVNQVLNQPILDNNSINDQNEFVQEDKENHVIVNDLSTKSTVTNMPTSSPRIVPNLLINTHQLFTNQCSQGQLLEISSAIDIIPGDFEFRVNPILMKQVKGYSVSMGNFGWNLVQQLYTQDELIGRNYRGGKGKLNLSPRRKHAIEHAVNDMYGNSGNNITLIANAVNGALRNKYKKPLQSIFEMCN